jgi:rubredoxin
MSDLPTLDGATDAIERTAKQLCPWLPDPFECPECKVYTDATRAYDPQTAAFGKGGYVQAWECPECEATFRREGY